MSATPPPSLGTSRFLPPLSSKWRGAEEITPTATASPNPTPQNVSLHPNSLAHSQYKRIKNVVRLLNRRGATRKPELDVLIANLGAVLKEMQEIVNRYQSLGKDQKRTWDRVGFAKEDLGALRGKLALHVGAIELFVASLSAGSLARIEGILDELVRDIKAGRKEPSVVSTCEDDDEVAWSELERELVGDGITRQEVERYKEGIKEYLRKLIRENLVGIESWSSDSLDEGFDEPEFEYGPSSQCSFQGRQLEVSGSTGESSTLGSPPEQDPTPILQQGHRGHVSSHYGQSPVPQFVLKTTHHGPSLSDDADQQERHKKAFSRWVFNDVSSRRYKTISRFLNGVIGIHNLSKKSVPEIYAECVRVFTQCHITFEDIAGDFACYYVDSSPTRRSFGVSWGETGAPNTPAMPLGFQVSILKIPVLSLHVIRFRQYTGNDMLFDERSVCYKRLVGRIVNKLEI